MKRRLLATFLTAAMLGLPTAATVLGTSSPASANPPTIPTDESKVPHYFGPYPNWANSPQTLADAIVTIGLGTPTPVFFGNPLTARANATDYATPPGTLGPVFVALPAAVLPAGTLSSFQTWNEATAVGSPTPSSGNLFHAYVLRPTGTANQYTVVYDSGLLTVPTVAVSAVETFAVTPVAVNAGDVLGFYGEGIPVDTGIAVNPDLFSYPAPAAPAVTDTFAIGDPGFPAFSPQDRTYSFGAIVTPTVVDPGTGAQATATVDPKTGGISAITVTSPGAGYVIPPAVTITSPGVTPTALASAVAAISTGVVTSIAVNEFGFGFTTPSVTITGGGTPSAVATAQASGGVDNVVVSSGGSGYAIQPIVQFSLPNLPGGVQATGTATMTAGVVDPVITVVNPGSGYTSAPTVTVLDGIATVADPAIAVATIGIGQIDVTSGGAGYDSTPTVTITDSVAPFDKNASATASVAVRGAVTGITVTAAGAGYLTPGLKKFVDTLAGLTSAGANNIGNYIPVAVADTTTYPGSDYYEIAVVQYRHQFSSLLPPTLMRGYVQLSTSVVPGAHVPLTNANLDPLVAATPIAGYFGVDNPHYLGPTIVATKDKPVRILFRNLLPTGVAGDLFLPVDTSLMGAGAGPNMMTLDSNGVPIDDRVDLGSVLDSVRNPECGNTPKPSTCYSENRATLHLHGGITPWISDGTPHQWTTPTGEATDYPQGVSVSNVPDMPDPGPGALTFFYTNQQSARLMFYHDHAWGITRLNVYAGEAAGYLITDAMEQSLISPTGALAGLGVGTPLIIQDKTFVPGTAAMAQADPTWDYAKWGGEGNLWTPHVYMPAQNPGDPSGMSAFGRWMYGPWFWPPAKDVKYPPIDNPYYDPNCDPNVQPFCEPALIPSTPNISVGMEAFNDTPIVNGVAYPKTTVDPKAYRYRILNAANDRFWNLQWYVADPRTGTLSEVALKPAEVAAAQLDPNVFPTPDTTISPVGPSWIQIGTEGGFLPAPVIVPNQPTTWIIDPTRFDVGNVDQHSLLLAPAERADVIVDFSQFRGKTLILYNDAPAAFPARVSSYDYYTGGPDLSPAGAPTTLAGYGPNTRTIMQVTVSNAAPAVAFDRPGTTADRMGALNAAFAHKADGTGVFESSMDPIIVGQAAYNSAYGSNFVGSGWCNQPGAPVTAKCDGFARIQEGSQPTDLFKFDTLGSTPATTMGPRLAIKFEPKGMHDEMNSASFDEWGRMTANLGLEAPGATPLLQNIILYPFVNPPTEFLDTSGLPSSLNVTPIASAADGTQIWKLTHNGVDTHPIHFHLYDVQLINRVTWDNIIIPPEATELGWKDTVRVSPLEDTIVAVRPIVPTLPFGVPDSKRVPNPMMPVGAHGDPNTNGQEAGFNNTDTLGNPIDPIVNAVTNFGWEYVYHCHILSHEEMDMMRPVSVSVPRALPATPVLTWAPGSVILTWTDGTPVDYLNPASWTNPGTAEVGFRIERTNVATGVMQVIFNSPANTTTYTDVPDPTITYTYKVVAWNAAGDSPSNIITVLGLPAAPSALTAVVQPNAALAAGSQVAVDWVNNAPTATSIVLERAVGAGAFSVVATLLPADPQSYIDTNVVPGPYSYRVHAVNSAGNSAFAGPVTVTVPQPGSTTVVLSAPNPSFVGQNVTFDATVSPVLAAGIPSGTLTFTVNGVVTPVALDAAGKASIATSALPAGIFTITADYSGDSTFLPSSGSVVQTVNKAASATALVSSLNPSFVGDSLSFTATVTPTPALGSSITFTANGVVTVVPLDALGVASFATTALPAGTFTITADFAGDAALLASSGSVSQVVNKTATTTALVSSLNPSIFGTNVTFTATVSPSTATGNVVFSIDGVLSTVPVVAGSAFVSTSSLAIGAHAVTATYSGDAAFLGSASSTLTQTVGPVLRATNTVVTSNRNPSANFGQSITFTATVRPVTGTGIPTGTVQFSIDGVNVGAVLTLNAQGRATFSTSTLAAGSHNVIATYSGSAVFAGGGSATFVQLVNKAASTLTLTSNRNPAAVFGQSITFTARVQPNAAASGGTIQFTLDGAPVGGPMIPDATGRARLITSTLTVGSHSVSATYSGSVNYLPSGPAALTQLVNKANSNTAVTTSNGNVVRGTTVVFTATVTAVGPGIGTPTGTVQFRIDLVNVGAPVALNPSGQAALAFNTAPLTVGLHAVTAVYSSDGNFNASTSGIRNQRIR